MPSRKVDPSLARQRSLQRAARLKRLLATASVLGFAGFFGLAAQHVVRGASASTRNLDSASAGRAANASSAYFDQRGGDFSFGNPTSGLSSANPPAAPPPMAQTSVS